ncbi:MAG: hypothetical protein GYB66_16640, partial [Chloroflexi bacterium]|nr:hypothetical protein [Chloroflexota bacterium]
MRRRDFLRSVLTMLAGLPLLRFLKPAYAQWTGKRFLLPPTVHHVSETTATIYYWLAQPPSDGQLVVLKNETVIQSIPLPADQARAILTVEDLEPATWYDYRLEIDGLVPPILDLDLTWDALRFRTQPYEWPIRFAAVGDTGFGDQVTARLAEHIAGHALDFFVHLGDMVYRSQEYQNDQWVNWVMKYYLPFGDVLKRMPHYPTIGNHERDRVATFEGQAFYYWAFPPLNETEAFEGRRQWYSFVVNDVRFISLNTQCFFTDPGRHEQNAWLDEQLADNSYRTTIIFFHVPLWTSSTVHPNDGLAPAGDWADRFSSVASQIGMVMSGHAHLYERIHRGDVRYITAGGGSTSIYKHGDGIPGSQVVISLSSYILVEIH